jgi:large subunit ribosomal protein L21
VKSIIECAGFQYAVGVGDVISVPRMEAAEGAEVTLDRVLATTDGSASVFGTPTVAGVKVTAKVVSHGKGPKILVMKRKRRKDYRRKNGHRQQYTKLQILTIGK